MLSFMLLSACYFIDLCGAIAQLGERLNGIQEVSGSIPLSSTITNENTGRVLQGIFPMLQPLLNRIGLLLQQGLFCFGTYFNRIYSV